MPRRLFGFSPQAVHQLLAERDLATGQAKERAESVERKLAEALEGLKVAEENAGNAEKRATAAEETLRKLQAELAPARHELSQKAGEIATLRAQVSELREEIHEIARQSAEPVSAADPILGLLMQEIAPIVEAARVSATVMMEEARKASEQQAHQADETRQLLHRQAQSMASWWHGVNGLIDPITSSLEQSKAEIEQIPARVHDALSPLAELMNSVGAQLAELARMASPPSFEPEPEGEPEPERQPVVVDLTSAEPSEARSDAPAAGNTSADSDHREAHPPWRPVTWWPYAGSPGRPAAS